MKRSALLQTAILLFLFQTYYVNAGPAHVKTKLIREKGYFAIVDSATEKLIKALKYENVGKVSQGRIVVKSGDKVGYIDTDGNEITPFIYTEAKDFIGGMGVVTINKKYGAVNLSGKEVTGMKYDYVCEFSDGISMVTIGSLKGYINMEGQEILPAKYSEVDYTGKIYEGKLLRIKENGKYGYADKKGNMLVAPEYEDAANGHDFNEGLGRVKKDGLWGVINEEGKIILPFQYEDLGEFYNGHVLFSKGGKWGMTDKTGKVLIPAAYEDLRPDFSEGLIGFTKGGKQGFMDKNQKVVIPPVYDQATDYLGGLSKVTLKDKNGVINKSNIAVVPIKYDNLEINDQNGKPVIEAGIYKKTTYDDYMVYGCFDKTGKPIIPIQYLSLYSSDSCIIVASSFSGDVENVMGFSIKKKRDYGIFDLKGKVILPATYDDYESKDNYLFFSKQNSYALYIPGKKPIVDCSYIEVKDGLIKVNKGGTQQNGQLQGGLFGLYGMDTKVILPAEYELITDFSDGLACVVKNGKFGFIDRTGKFVVPMNYNFVIEGRFSDGLATVNIGGSNDPQKGFTGGKWGLINKTGEIVIPVEYEGAGLYGSGIVPVRKGASVGAIDITGKTVIPFEYQDLGTFNNGISFYRSDNMYGFIDNTGKKICSNIWQYAGNFEDGLAIVVKDNKMGFADRTGNLVIPARFDDGEPFAGGVTRVRTGNLIQLIDQRGNVIRQEEMKQ
jgi:hypothetical protein